MPVLPPIFAALAPRRPMITAPGARAQGARYRAKRPHCLENCAILVNAYDAATDTRDMGQHDASRRGARDAEGAAAVLDAARYDCI